ncbi:xyloglucan endotransglucosylase/hydrolase 32 [Actinidia rufa]|uniref:Xyloglucan endotransglucosylase/hydrolase 32 n=1 Tax=Actinidia rufa TaxID=165716 RepID=A0A7J0E113_9ERIC|nr:xyloglucan endotransglucosylase/hydrolase 32 [Actinidia rufa]
MAFFIPLVLILMIQPSNASSWPPSPGHYPSSKFRSMTFYQGFRNLWGPQHQRMDNNALAIWLDSSSGSGFKSVRPFRSGYFGASIKLQPGYTAGVITAFYRTRWHGSPVKGKSDDCSTSGGQSRKL